MGIDLKKLKAALPKDKSVRLMRRTGYSRNFIDKVFRGVRESDIVIRAAVKLADEYQKEQQEILEKYGED